MSEKPAGREAAAGASKNQQRKALGWRLGSGKDRDERWPEQQPWVSGSGNGVRAVSEVAEGGAHETRHPGEEDEEGEAPGEGGQLR